MRIQVLYRACDGVTAFNKVPRPFSLSKTELIKICFSSLWRAGLNFDISWRVLGDKLSPEILEFFSHFKDVQIENHAEGLGNEKSLERSFDWIREQSPEDWIYFCEDDYLHHPESFEHIVDLIERRDEIIGVRPTRKTGLDCRLLALGMKKAPLIINPSDCSDRYLPEQRRPSYVFLGSKIHWRQVSNTTYTFLLQAKTLEKFKKDFYSSLPGARDGKLSKKIYGRNHFLRKALCVSPLPSLANHMHEGLFSPFVDWQKILNDSQEFMRTRTRIGS